MTSTPSKYPHIKYIDCAETEHSSCSEATCDSNILASEYWETKRLEDIKNRDLHSRMAPMMHQ